MKYSGFLCGLIFMSIINSYAQVVTGLTISVPPAPSGTSLPVPLNTNTVEYNAEESVTLTPGFETAGVTSSNYFLARIQPYTSISFAKLHKELNSGYYFVSSGLLNFKFEEEYFVPNGGSLTYKVFDQFSTEVTSNTTIQVAGGSVFKYGDNRFRLDILALTSGQFYTLEVQNQKGEKWYLKFKKN